MKISLIEFNAKNAQFRILPRYKVKSEGEVVQLYDQIVFESVKSPGHYFHASDPYQIDSFSYGSELNLGVERSSFTLIGSYRDRPEEIRFVRGGCVVRLFHKELEAYLVAEGLFDEAVIEDVHFRIRAIDQHRPKSLSPSTSGITYWQVEAEHSILDGDVLRWEQQIRLRHMLTRQYLSVDTNGDVLLTPDPTDPRTVFRLHSVLKERDEIQLESYARIEHMLTNRWLHALKDEDYEKRQYNEYDTERTMQGLRWDGASLRKVSASMESMYDDAYTIQQVKESDVLSLNYVAGMVPFLFNLIQDQLSNTPLTARRTHEMITTLHEIKEFIMPDGIPDKNRQKLLRNLRVIDLLVKLLQCPLREEDEQIHMIRIFKEAYDVLHAYMLGKSRKNALYIAKYIDFFQTQFTQKGGIGLNVTRDDCWNLIRDKRKIVEQNKSDSHRYIHSAPSLQSKLSLLRSPSCFIQLPQIMIQRKINFSSDQVRPHESICLGRNDFKIHTITREFGYITWEDAFLCIQSDILLDSIRAKFTDLCNWFVSGCCSFLHLTIIPPICQQCEAANKSDYYRNLRESDEDTIVWNGVIDMPIEVFVTMFKQTEQGAAKKRTQFNLEPLLYETYNADLSQYKYEQIIVKSLDLLNKLYSSQMDMFSLTKKAQIFLTRDSAFVFIVKFCYLPKTPEEPHPMNQNIITSHGILSIVLDILLQEIDSRLLR
ncbi:hypothetical protein Btru_072533, partial [Bulinus truncatus]